MDDIFSQMFPILSGISFDLGTVLTAILFLGFLVIGFDLIKAMLFGRMDRHYASKHADYFYSQAEQARQSSDSNTRGSIGWEEQNLIYQRFLRKSVDSRLKGWR